MTAPVSKERAAYDLSLSINKGYKLVVESLEWVLKRKDELIRRLRENAISKSEFDEEMAEVELLNQQVKAFVEQLKKSNKKVKKIFGNQKNNR